MYRFFRKNREAVKKYLLIFFLSIVSIGMVITLAPLRRAIRVARTPTFWRPLVGPTSPRRTCSGLSKRGFGIPRRRTNQG